jgi:hypothetical protein
MKEALIDDYSSLALIGGNIYGLFYGINLSVAVAVGFYCLVWNGNRNSKMLMTSI